MIGHYRRLVAYDRWANAAVVAALRAADPAPPAALKLLAHVAAAERLWLDRIDGRREPIEVWPDQPLVEIAATLGGLDDRWEGFFAGLVPERLEEPVSYVNSKGEPWSSTVGDILTHVTLHSAYHRGQIATALRAAGHAPAYTDFIHATRQGIIT